MQKFLYLHLWIVFVSLLTGCTTKEQPLPTSANTSLENSMSDYFAMRDNCSDNKDEPCLEKVYMESPAGWQYKEIPSKPIGIVLPPNSSINSGYAYDSVDVHIPSLEWNKVSIPSFFFIIGDEHIDRNKKLVVRLFDAEKGTTHEHWIIEKDNVVNKHLFIIKHDEGTITMRLSPEKPTKDVVNMAWRVFQGTTWRMMQNSAYAEFDALENHTRENPPSVPSNWKEFTFKELPFSIPLSTISAIQIVQDQRDEDQRLKQVLGNKTIVYVEGTKVVKKYSLKVADDPEHPIQSKYQGYDFTNIFITLTEIQSEDVYEKICPSAHYIYQKTIGNFVLIRCNDLLMVRYAPNYLVIFEIEKGNPTPFMDAILQSLKVK